MQVTETQSDGLKREYKVVITAAEIAEKVEHRLQEVGQQARLPGFRPGKVPLQVLKQRFGPSVMGEIVERAVNDSSSQTISERGLRPAVQPKIEIVSFDEGKDLEFTMAIEVLPEIKMMDFSEIAIERPRIEVEDAEVAQALEQIAASRKGTQPLDKPRKSASGDVLVIDFQGTVDGEAFPGMAADDHHLELGSNSFIAGFEDQLIGVDVGAKVDVKVTFPDAYMNDQLAGKEAVFAVTVKDILEAVPAAIDDALATSLGEENLETLRGKVREQIGQDYEQLCRGHLKRALLDKLAEGHDFEVPPAMLDSEFETIWKQFEEAREQGRVDPDDEGKEDEALKEEYRAIAERRVRLGLLLAEVGRVNGIDVTQDEMNRAMQDEIRRHPGREREVFEFFKNTPEAAANLRAPIFEDKVIDFITALAKVEDKTVTLEELNQSAASEAETPKKSTKKKTSAKPKASKKEEKGE